MKKWTVFLLMYALHAVPTLAQRHEVLNPNIASVQVVAGTDWLQMPVITLHGDKVINIAFDDNWIQDQETTLQYMRQDVIDHVGGKNVVIQYLMNATT